MVKITLKKIKEADDQYAHTEVYSEEVLLGYFIVNRSRFSGVNENWNFVSKHEGVRNFPASRKSEIILTIENELREFNQSLN